MEPAISMHQLVTWVTGELAPADAEAFAARVEADPAARMLAAQLRKTLEAISTLEAPAPEATARAVALMGRTNVREALDAAVTRWLQGARLAVATLVNDTRGMPRAGYRAGATPTLLGFESEYGRVDLQVVGGAAGIAVRGQVDPAADDEEPAVMAYLMQDGATTLSSPIDDSGYFEFSSTVGQYDLAIELGSGNRAIVIRGLDTE